MPASQVATAPHILVMIAQPCRGGMCAIGMMGLTLTAHVLLLFAAFLIFSGPG